MKNKFVKGMVWFVLIFFILISVLSVLGPAFGIGN